MEQRRRETERRDRRYEEDKSKEEPSLTYTTGTQQKPPGANTHWNPTVHIIRSAAFNHISFWLPFSNVRLRSALQPQQGGRASSSATRPGA